MRRYPFSLAAPVNVATDTPFIEAYGTFVRYHEETSGAIANVVLFKTDRGDELELKPGQSARLEQPFARITLANRDLSSSLTGKIVVGGAGAEIFDSNVFGNVSVITYQNPTTPAVTAKTVTNASAQLLAANTARRQLIIQNNDAAARVWINCGAGAATSALYLIPPGDEKDFGVCVPTTAIQAIGDAASNPNVVVVEG